MVEHALVQRSQWVQIPGSWAPFAASTARIIDAEPGFGNDDEHCERASFHCARYACDLDRIVLVLVQ